MPEVTMADLAQERLDRITELTRDAQDEIDRLKRENVWLTQRLRRHGRELYEVRKIGMWIGAFFIASMVGNIWMVIGGAW